MVGLGLVSTWELLGVVYRSLSGVPGCSVQLVYKGMNNWTYLGSAIPAYGPFYSAFCLGGYV